ncbi:MAG: sulfotransferase family protein [Actinomycetota bacterium]
MPVDKKAIRKSLRTNFNPGPRDYLNRALLRGRQAVHLPGLLTGGEPDRPVFIIGAPRSGTSLLYAVLRASSRLAHWPGEAHEVWEADFHPALTGWTSNVLTAEDASGPEAERIKRSFYLVTGGRRRLIDKTPRNSLRVPFIDALFPEARFVYLQRDGRENINSLINAWRTPRYRTYRLPEPHSIPGVDPAWWKFVLYPGWHEDAAGPLEVVCAKQWLKCNDAALDASRAVGLDRWVEVRYEQLIDDPVSEVKRLVEFLGLPYGDRVKQKAADVRTKPVNVVTPVEAGKWRHENPDEIAAVLPLIEPTMNAMGYELDEN